MNKVPHIPYLGAKARSLDKLLPLLPHTPVYVEPFAGSLCVFFNKRPISDTNILSDRNANLVNMFRVIRDAPDELARRISLTPLARMEYERHCRPQDSADPIERARQTMGTLTMSITATTGGTWRRFLTGNRFPAGNVPKIRAQTEVLQDAVLANEDGAEVVRLFSGDPAVRGVLEGAVLENRRAADIIAGMDSKDILIYCDPPYVPEARRGGAKYGAEMSRADHEAFLSVCLESNAKIAISGYATDLYESMLADWRRVEWPTKMIMSQSRHGDARDKRLEIVWMNYAIGASRLL